MIESEKQLCKLMNERVGNPDTYTGVDCNICQNKEVIYEFKDDEIKSYDCTCVKERKIIRTLKDSGLYHDFETKTFETFTADTKHHVVMKEKALNFVETENNDWFFVGGQSGCGKTHLCTAISKKLIEKGNNFKYMQFTRVMPSLIYELKSFNPEVKTRAEMQFDRYKEAQVLYIDDFLKVNIREFIFELIDFRYKNNLKTIISSELYIEDIFQIDEAVGGRIHEKAKKGENIITIKKDSSKNYRMSMGVVL